MKGVRMKLGEFIDAAMLADYRPIFEEYALLPIASILL